MDAGAIAGFDVVQLVNEPSAAAIALDLRAQFVKKNVLVVDVGAGKVDVSSLYIDRGEFKVCPRFKNVRVTVYMTKHIGLVRLCMQIVFDFCKHVCKYVCACMYVCMHVCMNTWVYACICGYACVYMHVYLYVFV